jgi:imidazolonepropionase-like amidohydrolase
MATPRDYTAPGPPGPATLALADARIIDGTGAPPTPGRALVISGDTIAAIEDGPPAGVPVIDVAGRTVMPGLIDAHVHLASLTNPVPPPELRPYRLALAARAMVEHGITTVRDLGSYGRELFDLRAAIEAGLIPGPRLVLCGQIVAATSPGAGAFPGMYREADGPDEMRKAVREQIRQGADVIKVMSTGALTVALEDVHPAQVTEEELAAVVDEAHRMGFLVASHAEGADGIRLSVAAGVDTVEHGDMGAEVPEALAQMAAAGTIMVPTLSVFHAVAGTEWPSGCGWMCERGRLLGESAARMVAAARAAGVPIAMGADAGPHGANARELVHLTEAGLPPAEAIVAATATSARACGLADRIGVLRPWMLADLIVVDGDPLADPAVLCDASRIWRVFQSGRLVAAQGVVTSIDVTHA